MSKAQEGTPWHLWAVGILGVLWNGFGAYDYFMTKTSGEAYMSSLGMTEAQIAYTNAMPAWMTAIWAIGVWGALAGSLLLLMRSKWAVLVFVLSLAAYVMSLLYNYALSDGAEIMGGDLWIMQAIILAGCVFFAWYAWFARQRGWLR
jgi:hypothetical protein